MLISILMLFFQFFCQSYFLGGKFGPIIWSSPNWLNFVEGTILYAYYDFNDYFFKNFIIHIIFDKIWSCPSWLESSIYKRYWYYMLIIKESYNLSKFFCSKYYWQILFHLVFFILTELHRISKLNFSKNGEQFFPKNLLNGKYFEKLHIKTVISI